MATVLTDDRAARALRVRGTTHMEPTRSLHRINLSAPSSSTRKMVLGITLLGAVCCVGVLGYVVAGWDLGDAAYMVVITIFGVGYGEVQPVASWWLRVFTGVVIVAGYGAVIYTMGGFIQMVIDGQLNHVIGERRMRKELDKLHGHTIICGFGRMGSSLAAELEAAGQSYVAIDERSEAVDMDIGADGILVIGDATDESVLERAGVRRAAVLATVLSHDATNVFVTLTARSMNPEVMIIARGEARHTQPKLLSCGADHVVMPTDIGATRISQLIVRPNAEEMLASIGATGDIDLVTMGLDFEEVELTASSPLANRRLRELEVRGAYGYIIVAVRRGDGSILMHPDADLRLDIGDRLIVLGYSDQLLELGSVQPLPEMTYRGVRSR